jgi:hypothetical protein
MKKILKEWKRFINEVGEILPSALEEEPLDQSLPVTAVPGELYYVFPRKYLWNVAQEGIVDFREPQHGTDEISKEEGILLYNDFSEAVKKASATGQLILVVDGGTLGAEGQYEFYPENLEPGVFKTKVKMIDSAADSGNGASDLVDQLGTVLPIRHAKGILFGEPMTPAQADALKARGLGDLHVASYTPPTQ